MNNKARKKLPVILIIVGVVLILVSVIYMLTTYPIGMWFNKGFVDVEDLPEPGMLPTAISTSYESAEDPGSGDDLPIENIGTIKVPALQLSENIVEGTESELLYGVGRLRESAQLGQNGNCVLAGHRNYIQMHPFRFMDKLSVGDLVYIETENYKYTYKIYDILTVKADENWVLEPQLEEEAMLTLVTCTPVLNPVNRLIAWGTLIETEPKD